MRIVLAGIEIATKSAFILQRRDSGGRVRVVPITTFPITASLKAPGEGALLRVSPENARVLPTCIVNVDFCVSLLCCWALTPSTQTKLTAARNKVRVIAQSVGKSKRKSRPSTCPKWDSPRPWHFIGSHCSANTSPRAE